MQTNTNYAMEDCIFPEDIMVCILTRLPVKSIIKFKSVCKPWLYLFSTQEFKKAHDAQYSSNPKNQSFIVHGVIEYHTDTISLFNIDSRKTEPTILDHPFSHIRINIDIVGCCNGLFCINPPAFGQVIVFWNPAMNLFKRVWPSKLAGAHEIVSLGFGYDDVGCDFKVVRIVYNSQREGENMRIKGVELYSVNSGSWMIIDAGFQFSTIQTKSDVVVNGNPYWVSMIDDNEVLICFDVTKSAFEIVSLFTLDHDKDADVELVDWNGSLGALVFSRESKRVEFDVWVFDDVEQIWRKIHTFGPIEMNVYRFLLCMKNGRILGERPDRKLFVFDTKTGCVDKLFNGARQSEAFEIYGYTESLAYIRGMDKVNVVRGRNRWQS